MVDSEKTPVVIPNYFPLYFSQEHYSYLKENNYVVFKVRSCTECLLLALFF